MRRQRFGRFLSFVAGVCTALCATLDCTAHVEAAAKVGRARSPAASAEPAQAPEARLVQVQPAIMEGGFLKRSTGQKRAVVLIHGYWVHFRKEDVRRALLRDWQEPNSLLVNALAPDGDVFAFAYGQTTPLEDIVALPALRDSIGSIKKLGYSEIVLVGHSAGGLIARQFAEDNPESGVTKVVQVSAPNGGTVAADFKWVPKCQKAFLMSLSMAGRVQCLARRSAKRVPDGIQFVCIMTLEDKVVPPQSQWTKDLQDQGVPVIRVPVGHGQVVRKAGPAQKIAEAVRAPQPRWKAEQVTGAAADIGRSKKSGPIGDR